MTEADWHACADPTPMLAFLRGKVSETKQRLFGVACCRRIWPLLKDERSRRAVEIAEQYGAGGVSLQKMRSARLGAEQAERDIYRQFCHRTVPYWVYCAAKCARLVASDKRWKSNWEFVAGFAFDAVKHHAGDNADRDAERAFQRRMIHDVFGNPFRPAFLPSSVLAWNDGAIRKMAQLIYDDRAFDRLPILADALEDAGCADEAILSHCRGPGEHVRGCWVVDLLLGKT